MKQCLFSFHADLLDTVCRFGLEVALNGFSSSFFVVSHFIVGIPLFKEGGWNYAPVKKTR